MKDSKEAREYAQELIVEHVNGLIPTVIEQAVNTGEITREKAKYIWNSERWVEDSPHDEVDSKFTNEVADKLGQFAFKYHAADTPEQQKEAIRLFTRYMDSFLTSLGFTPSMLENANSSYQNMLIEVSTDVTEEGYPGPLSKKHVRPWEHPDFPLRDLPKTSVFSYRPYVPAEMLNAFTEFRQDTEKRRQAYIEAFCESMAGPSFDPYSAYMIRLEVDFPHTMKEGGDRYEAATESRERMNKSLNRYIAACEVERGIDVNVDRFLPIGRVIGETDAITHTMKDIPTLRKQAAIDFLRELNAVAAIEFGDEKDMKSLAREICKSAKKLIKSSLAASVGDIHK